MGISNTELSRLLKAKTLGTSFVNKLKISYRPYICPFDELLEKIPTGASVYDMGCGSGMFLMLVSEYRKPAKLGGAEISPELIENAKALLSGFAGPTQLSVFDGENIPQEFSEYDVITLIDVLHHVPVPYQERFLRNISEKMKRGATLIIKDIDAQSPLHYFNKLHDLMLAGEIGNEWRYERTRDYVQSLGMTIQYQSKRRMIVYPHFTLLCLKTAEFAGNNQSEA